MSAHAPSTCQCTECIEARNERAALLQRIVALERRVWLLESAPRPDPAALVGQQTWVVG